MTKKTRNRFLTGFLAINSCKLHGLDRGPEINSAQLRINPGFVFETFIK